MKTLFQYTRQITSLLVICLTVSLHCLAGDSIPDNEIWYTSHSGSTFSPYNSSGFGANIVSNTYENGKGIIKFDGNVTTIPNQAFQSQMDSKSYTLPNTVTSIGNSAFYDNYYLQEITFSNSLTTIGEAAFGYNFALTELHLPNTLTYLKRSAFYGCNKVTSFYCAASTPPTCGDGAIGNCHSNRKIYVPYYAVDDYKNAAKWSDYASSIEGYDSNGNKIFYTTTDGKSISVPDSTAFGPKLLTNTYEEGQGTLTFAGDITKLPEGIFKGFTTLKTLTFPESVTGIEANAFDSCTNLSELNIPGSVSSFGLGIFRNCPALERFTGVYASSDGRCCVVKNILRAFAPKGLSEYTLPEKIYAIASGAFSNSTELEAITIPDSVTTFGGGIFNGCSKLATINGKYATADKKAIVQDHSIKTIAMAGLTSYTIPQEATSISAYCFMNCTGLTSIQVGDQVKEVGDGAFQGCTGLKDISLPTTITIWPSDLFKGCTGLTKATIPAGVTMLGSGIFYGCNNITDITYKAQNAFLTNYDPSTMTSVFPLTATVINIGDSVQSLPSYLFCNHTGLRTITIPDNVTSLGEKLFSGCTGLDSIFVSAQNPASCKSNTFSNMGENAKIYVPRDLVSTYEEADGWNNFKSIIFANDIPAEKSYLYYTSTDGQIVTPSNTSAFNCKIFSNTYKDGQGVIAFVDTLKTIGNDAFLQCSNLKSITIPSTVTEIGQRTFRYCGSLENAILPEGLTSIGYDAFSVCSVMKSITLPGTVSFIGYCAFNCCYALDSVVCSGNVPATIEWSVFANNASDRIIYVPRTAVEVYEQASYWSDYKNYIYAIPDGESHTQEIYYTSSDSSIITPSNFIGAKILSNTYENGRGIWVVDRVMTVVGANAFQNIERLTGISLPSTITAIKESAFYGCSKLNSIVLPDSINNIGRQAFYDCNALKSITWPDSLKTISYQAFYSCDSLEDITLPAELERIEQEAFHYCSTLRKVTLPDSLNFLGYDAFNDCSSLIEVHCKAVVPPTCDYTYYGRFDRNAAGRRIYVPEQSTSLYENASGWSQYKSDIYSDSGNTCEIHYTTTDSMALSVSNRFSNAQLLTNVYTDGKGTLTMDRQVTSLNSSAFSECSTLATIELPQEVTAIPNNAFYNCQSLTNITLSDSLKTIGEYAFYNCGTLSRIVFPDSIVKIENYAFRDCRLLDSIVLTKNLSSIGYYTFGDCKQLNTIYCTRPVPPSISDGTFYNLNDSARIYISDEYISDYENNYPWNVYQSHIYAISDSTYEVHYTSSDSTAITTDTRPFNAQTLSNSCENGNGVFVMDRQVTSVSDNAFKNCSTLISIDLPETVSSIGEYAFCDCDTLSGIVFPDSLQTIGNYAFYSCNKLDTIILPEKLTGINDYALAYCSNLKAIYCKSPVPPSINWSTFYDLPADTKFFIAEAYISDYETANNWSSFKSRMYVISDSTYEVHYTSSDSLIVTPHTRPFNAQILSNTCKDGQGTFVLDRQVTSINSNAFYECSTLTGIDLPDSITSIPSNAFYGCSRLDSITLPQSLTNIGDHAFYSCDSLSGISLPDSLLRIENYAFEYCGKLKSITLPAGLSYLGYRSFGSCSRLESIYCQGAVPAELNRESFDNLPSDARIYVPEEYFPAYEDKWSRYNSYLYVLSDITYELHYTSSDSLIVTPYTRPFNAQILSNTCKDGQGTFVLDRPVTSMNSNAFYQCSTLTGIDLPDSITSIPSYAFYGCSQLDSIALPQNATDIGYLTFYSCNSLNEIVLPDSLLRIGDYAFEYSGGLQSITLPARLSYLGHRSFGSCSQLRTIYCEGDIPADMNGNPFENLPDDYMIYITENLLPAYEKKWSNYKSHIFVLSDTTYEMYYTTSDSLTVNINSSNFNAKLISNKYEDGRGVLSFDRPINNIGAGAFSNNCSNLTGITIPESVEEIGDNAFAYCRGLDSVVIPNTVHTIQYKAFYQCTSLQRVVLPDSLTTIPEYCFYECYNLSDIRMPASLPSIGHRAFQECTSLKSLTLPDSLSDIADYAFSRSGIESITIPPAMTTVRGCTFEYSALKQITFHNGIKSIESHAFYDCNHLKSVTYPDSVVTVAEGTFISCDSLTEVILPKNLKNIEYEAFRNCPRLAHIDLPDSLQYIDRYAFCNSGLQAVTIPSKVQSLGDNAFCNCYSLKDVTFKSTEPVALLNTSVFSGNHSNRIFHVPANTAEAYRNAYNWSQYAPYIFEEGFVSPCAIHYTTSDSSLITPNTDRLYKDSLMTTNVIVYDNQNVDGEGVLSMGDTVSVFGNEAFSWIDRLTSITLPEATSQISSYAFYYCRSLQAVHLKSTTPPAIGSNAFCQASSDLVIYVPAEAYDTYDNCGYWDEYTLYLTPEGGANHDSITYATTDSVKLVPYNLSNIRANLLSHTFDTLTGKGVMVFDRPVKSIGESTFRDCKNLKEIVLPANLVNVGSLAFYYCSSLKSVTLPSRLRSIGSQAFDYCHALDTVKCLMENPATLSSSNVFNNNSSTRLILVPEGTVSTYEAADNWSNYASSIFSIAILDGDRYNIRYTTKNESTIAVNNNDKLFGDAKCYRNTYTVNDGGVMSFDRPIETICENAFANNSLLKTIDIPSTVTTIEASAFEGCTALTTVSLSEGLKTIRAAAFSKCTRLQSITLPESLNGIGINAFYKCTRLSEVICKRTSAATLGENAFLETSSKLKILVPLSAFNDYESKWSGFADYIFANCDNGTVIPYTSNKSAVNPTQASSFDGKVFSNALESGEEEPEDDSHPDNEIWYTTSNGCVTSPYTTSGFGAEIVSNTYEDGQGIIVFDGPVTTIPGYGFYRNMELITIELPNEITRIEDWGFYDNYNLQSITFPKNLESIGQWSFGYNWTLTTLHLPSSLSRLDGHTFYGCYAVTELYCESLTPPACNDEAIANGNSERYIYVPTNSVSAYKNAAGWSDFASSIEGYNFKASSAPSLQSLTSVMQKAAAADTTARKYLMTMDRPITLIGVQAFKEQNALVSMTLPEGITQIGVEAFSSDSSLTTIELPSTMATIGLDAFKDCPVLTRVHCHATVPPALGSGAFDNCASNMRICVPDSLVNTYRSADVWTDYRIHIVGDSSAAAKSYDDIGKVATPVISLANHVVTITCATTGATIHYTTDGSKPTTGSSKYTQPFTLEQNCTVTAYAVKDECFDSDISSIDCNDFKAETPVINYSEGKITITSTQSNVTIHYTLDGSTPTVNSTVYTGPIVPTHNLTIQAIASKDDVTDSEVAVYKVEDFYVDNPVISCNANGEVSMTTATTGARIYYTIDGSTPQKGSTLYSGPFVPSSNVLVKAIAAKSDFNNSAVATYQVTYYTAKRPTISVVESEGSALVTISSETKNAVIWYTLDGNEPTTSSSRYSGAFSLNENCIIKAFATATDLTDSQVACDTVSLFKVAAPVIETAGTEFSITCTTAASTIHYTLDGTMPTAKSSKYETPVTVTRNCLIKAIAMRSNYNDSEVSSASISSFQTKMPALHYFEGTVTMECATEGAKIYYTTDGSRPTTASTLYKEAFVASTGIVIKAIASFDGFNDSETASMTIYPTNCDVPAASFDGEQFRFDGLADGTTVYYTLDGTYPTTDSYVYDGKPVALNDFLTVRAIATAAEKNNSTPSSLTPRALFHRAEMTAEVKEAGALKEAFGWCQSVLSDTVVSVSGALNAADLSFIRTSGWFEQLDLSEATLPDNYLPDSAFLTSSIVSVTLPGGIDSTGVRPFGGCSHLAAIQWNASMQMPSSLLQGVDNPNLLVFVDDQQQAPDGWGNVVVDGYADSITLATSKGNCDFHAPMAFTAHKITFTRSFTQESGYKSCAGWESLSLPFQVETIEHATKGVLTPFGLEGSDRHFWLYSLQASGFTAEQVIQAQYPYLICLPHNSAYAAASDLGGTLTFSATDAYIEATGETFTGLRRGNLLFMPNFRRQSSDESTLVLNTYQTYEGNLPGSVFVSSLRDIEPFEAYLQSVSIESAPRIFSLSGDATGLETAVIESGYTVRTIRGGVRIEASADVEIPVYTLTGQRVELVVLTAGDEEELPLAPGIYLVGTQKVVVGK